MPREAKREALVGEPSFQQQQARVHSHCWFWEVWSQADTAENPHREEGRASPQKINPDIVTHG